jgi:cobyric acid synthase
MEISISGRGGVIGSYRGGLREKDKKIRLFFNEIRINLKGQEVK